MVALVLSGVTALLLNGSYAFQGPVIARLTYSHGVHAGDVLVLLGWAVAMAALVLLARRPDPHD